MRRTMYCLAAAGVMLAASGCVFYSYKPTEVFELHATAPDLKGKTYCQVLEFRNNTGTGKYLTMLQPDGVVSELSESRWVSAPGLLVSRALNRALLPDGKIPQEFVTGTLEVFAAEPEAHRFLLSGTFSKGGKVYSYHITAPLAGNEPKDIVKAANLAVSQLAGRIAGTR